VPGDSFQIHGCGTAIIRAARSGNSNTAHVAAAADNADSAHAGGDLCPVTGRARLSYRRAEESFELATRPLANPGATPEELEVADGWTLHQPRHSLLTHEAEDGTSTPMLLARSRHASVRSLERYARPGPEAVAAHVAASDPAAPPAKVSPEGQRQWSLPRRDANRWISAG
jgi:hypothetical protein